MEWSHHIATTPKQQQTQTEESPISIEIVRFKKLRKEQKRRREKRKDKRQEKRKGETKRRNESRNARRLGRKEKTKKETEENNRKTQQHPNNRHKLKNHQLQLKSCASIE